MDLKPLLLPTFITWGFIFHYNILSAPRHTAQQKSLFTAAFIHLQEKKEPHVCFVSCQEWCWAAGNEPHGNNFTSGLSHHQTDALWTNKSLGPLQGKEEADPSASKACYFHLMARPEQGCLSSKGLHHIIFCTALFYFLWEMSSALHLIV